MDRVFQKQELTAEQKKTFADLQKRTMELIASFCDIPADELPAEMKGCFLNMMTIYEANPTAETAKILSEKIGSRDDTAESKKQWLEDTAKAILKDIPKEKRAEVRKKAQEYMSSGKSVPDGVPPSGTLLDGLGFISREEKNNLMEAQAAARLISHVDVLHDFQPKTSYQNADGSFENAFLDKPFATKMQRLEHLVSAVVNDIYTQNEAYRERLNENNPDWVPYESKESYTILETKAKCERNTFLQKARDEALSTLIRVASTLEKTNPTASKRIADLANGLDTTGNIDLEKSLSEIKKIEGFYERIFGICQIRPFYDNRGFGTIKGLNSEITDRLNTLIEAQKPLTKKDYDALKESVKGSPVAGLVEHRIKQILSMDAAKIERRRDGNANG